MVDLTYPDFQGKHNSDLNSSINRLYTSQSYKDLGTICIIPNSGAIHAKVAERWLYQISQMNQKFMRLMMMNLEKNFAYNAAIEQILTNPGLSTFKYILTLEETILPPLDGLPRLFESIGKYDVVGGLIWSKGEEGKPQIFGHPNSFPLSFQTVSSVVDGIQPCLGLTTSYTLFKLDIFRDPRVPRPWFRTPFLRHPGKNPDDMLDLFFFENIQKLGYKVACDTRIKAGNYDLVNDLVW